MGKQRGSTGVEERAGSLRITFHYRGERCRETLKIPPTPGNKKYAANLRGQILAEIAQGTFDYGRHFPESSRAPLSSRSAGRQLRQVAEVWEQTLTVAASTRKAYLKYLRNHILPAFGGRAIDSILQSELEVFRAQLAADYRPKTVNQILLVLRGIFDLAEGDGLLDRNPARRIKNVRNARHSVADPFTPAELALLLTKAQERDPALHNMLDLWWVTGLRPSELIALRWGDVDWTYNRLHICRGAVDNEITDGKTHSERFVDVHPRGMAALQRQKAATFLAGAEVFLGATGRPMGDCQMLSNRVHRLYAATGVRTRAPYQFRHTFASMMLSSREPPLFVAKQMGHGSLTMLERHYARWMETAAWSCFDDAVQAVASALGQSKKVGRNAPYMPHGKSGANN